MSEADYSANYARVGKRSHLITVETRMVPVGWPRMALCTTIFIPSDFEPGDDVPKCYDCFSLEESRTIEEVRREENRIMKLTDSLNKYVKEVLNA